MRRLAWLVLVGGCSLYFDDPSEHHAPDAGTFAAFDGGSILPAYDGPKCPAGVSATITYPADGSANVPLPVAMQITANGYGPYEDLYGYIYHDVGSDGLVTFDDPSCTTQPPTTSPTSWTDCFTNLDPGTTYHYTVMFACPGWLDAEIPLASATFTTAM
jgi:hypothetical protein